VVQSLFEPPLLRASPSATHARAQALLSELGVSGVQLQDDVVSEMCRCVWGRRGVASWSAARSRLDSCTPLLHAPPTPPSLHTSTSCLRLGASELHVVASVMGGMAAQEAIKLLTQQFVPFT
jgi:hypothetical protein